MQKSFNLQDYFLNQARKDRVGLTIFLMNGVQIKGSVRGFDNFIVIIESDGKQQMIYKHAISTIIPIRAIDMSGSKETTAEA
ncbi:RNA chaperone Hfq [Oscillospiraceae bacterium OttesenSCG-928-F05]|nr:RNA chaperone Hfq [Oscillospiraceae bacterium OttesenSCG-928-F05]